MPQFAANLSMLYPELDFLDRFEAAAKDGFKGVEFLFPYAYDKAELAARLKANGLQQVLFNGPPGNWDAGERGMACLPGREAEFREDLYYRLNGITLFLPMLRDRADKADLIHTLLKEENGGQDGVEIAEDAFQCLLSYGWPGNVRQLRNALRTACALCRDGTIRISNLPQEILDAEGRDSPPEGARRGAEVRTETPPSAALRQAECTALKRELERMRWNISRTALALGISRNTLYRKMHKHGIVPEH